MKHIYVPLPLKPVPMKVTLRAHTKRCNILKGLISVTFIAGFIFHPSITPFVATFGNFIWLWFDFE